jgi:hypothetical protein
MKLKVALAAFATAMAGWLLYQLGVADLLGVSFGGPSSGGCKNGQKYASVPTMEEFIEFTDGIAKPWKADAIMVSFFNSPPGPLQPTGRSTEWMAKYFSPSSKRGMMISLGEGKIYCSTVRGSPAGDIPDLKADYFRNGAALYVHALEQGKALIDKGYGVKVNLYSIASDKHHAMWHINYIRLVKGDFDQAEMYVVVDANTGQLEEVRNKGK